MYKSENLASKHTISFEINQSNANTRQQLTLNPQYPPTEEGIIPQNTRKPPKFTILIIVIFVGLIVLGFFALQYFQPNKENRVSVQAIQSPSPIPEYPIPTVNPLTTWKTYTNSKYNYTFKYPSEFTLNTYNQIETEEKSLELAKDVDQLRTSILLDVSPSSSLNKKMYEDYKAKAGKTVSGQLIEGGSEITAGMIETLVADNVAYQSTTESDKGILINTLTQRNNLTYQISLISESKYEKALFDRILSTFEFTNKTE